MYEADIDGLNMIVNVWSRHRNYLSVKYFDFEPTWWRLFQKRAVRSKFDIYVFIDIHLEIGSEGQSRTKFYEKIDDFNVTM
jgi:hypothetical protein